MSEVNTSMTQEEAQDKHWYIKINKRESGPYRFEEILLMINGNDIKEKSLQNDKVHSHVLKRFY